MIRNLVQRVTQPDQAYSKMVEGISVILLFYTPSLDLH